MNWRFCTALETAGLWRRLHFSRLGTEEQAWYLRIFTLSAVRYGMHARADAAKLLARLELFLPGKDRRVNEELVELCAALGSESFVPKALGLVGNAGTQEEQVLYCGALLQVPGAAWPPPQRECFLRLAASRVLAWKGAPM